MSFLKYEENDLLVSVNDVCLQYPPSRDFPSGNLVLNKVDFKIRNIHSDDAVRGQVDGILGGSGSGKSTLLNIMAGRLKPTSGSVLIGVDQQPTGRGKVGMVAQNYPLFEDMTVLDNLVLAACQHPDTKALLPMLREAKGFKAWFTAIKDHFLAKDAKVRAWDMIQKFGLETRAHAIPCELSGGQRQRAAIAQQLLCGHETLLLDEPISGQDLIHKEEAEEAICQTAAIKERVTIVVVSHDIRGIMSVSDTIRTLGPRLDADGRPVGGACVRFTYDLKAMGLAWQPKLRSAPEFFALQKQIEDDFRSMYPRELPKAA